MQQCMPGPCFRYLFAIFPSYSRYVSALFPGVHISSGVITMRTTSPEVSPLKAHTMLQPCRLQ